MSEKSRVDIYLEMTRKLLSMPDAWQDTDEGISHLDKIDRLHGQLADNEVERVGEEIEKFRFDFMFGDLDG